MSVRKTTVVVALALLALAPVAFGQTNEVPNSAGGGPASSVTPPRRLLTYEINGDHSDVGFSLFPGGFTSPLDGEIVIQLPDPNVPTICAVNCVGISIQRAVFLATLWDPRNNFLDEPMVLVLDPGQESVGSYVPSTGAIRFSLYLIDACGGPAVPMPLTLQGTLTNSRLSVRGDNGPIIDALMTVDIEADRVARRPHFRFSTEVGFPVADPSGVSGWVSDGDLLSERSCVFLRNHELTANLGIMPVVPDLGLDAATLTTYRPVFFSLEDSVWSETLGQLGHGDLLSITGHIVRTNAELIAPFGPTASVADAGLDAVHISTYLIPTATAPCCGSVLFSVEQRFYSGALGRWVEHGDLLSSCGQVWRTNRQLLANFNPIAIPCLSATDCPGFGPCGANEVPTLADLMPCASNDPTVNCIDFGLDAVYVTPRGDVWFSTECGFWDANLGWISGGDVLSIRGYVVRRNRTLVDVCDPLVFCANFGLDALDWVLATCNAAASVNAQTSSSTQSDATQATIN